MFAILIGGLAHQYITLIAVKYFISKIKKSKAMEQAHRIVVMTREELIGLIEEVIIRLRRMDDPVYDNRKKEGAKTRVYTAAEAAKILMCSPKDITGFIGRKILHASMFNRQYCIGEKSLIAFIVQNPLLLQTNK